MIVCKILLSIIAFPLLWAAMLLYRIFIGVLWGTFSKIIETIFLPIRLLYKIFFTLWLIISLPFVLVLDTVTGIYICAIGSFDVCKSYIKKV